MPGCSRSRRTCADRRFRTAQRRPREELVDDADFPLAAELPYEQSRALAEALAALPPEQRRVFVLREIVGLSYDEIAEEVDSTVASIQMLLFRARRSLRDVARSADRVVGGRSSCRRCPAGSPGSGRGSRSRP